MSTLKDLTDAISALQADIDAAQEPGVVTQAQLDAVAAQAQAAKAAFEAKFHTATVVNAESDVSSVALGGSVTLTGTVKPMGSGSIQWSKILGPGNVTFSTPTALNTIASFDAVGAYTLRLTYTDGTTNSNDVAITVN